MNFYEYPIIIYNPNAGNGKAKKLFSKYFKLLLNTKLFKKIDIFESNSKDKTINEIEQIHKAGKNDLIISFGGDGSISTVCNGLMKIKKSERLPVFPIPLGTGNSLLRDFKIHTINDAINSYKKGNSTFFDLIEVKELNGTFKWYCVNVLGMGFISDIADYKVKNGKKYGSLSYIFGSILGLKKFLPYKVKIIYDDKYEFKSDKTYFISFSNTKFTGGNIMIAPKASYNDGLIDIIVLHDIKRFDFIKGFLKAFKGRHTDENGCFYFQAKKLEVYAEPDFTLMPDGELEGKSPVIIENLKEQIKFIL